MLVWYIVIGLLLRRCVGDVGKKKKTILVWVVYRGEREREREREGEGGKQGQINLIERVALY